MLEFYDSNKKLISLGQEIGRGGEGTVFEVLDHPELVAKIYHEPISLDKAEKLRQMVALKSDKLLKLTAWVTDVLHDKSDNSIVGFVMPKINSGKAIHELYNPKSRRELFPEADWRFLIFGATNLARSFAVIHSHGHAIGDVNHGNVVIAKDSTVRLIDCDSYHLNAPDQSFLCEVGVSTHTPPELQGKSLRGLARTANHDAFGLAVLVFQLLFMGRHPFSGNFLGEEDNTLEISISEHRFAYGAGAALRQMQQPPGTLSLSAISPRVANLFLRAFLKVENRPTAREWIEALKDLSQNLRSCETCEAHYFLQSLDKCPWCNLIKQFGVDFFEKQGVIKYQAGESKTQSTCENCRKTIKQSATHSGLELCQDCLSSVISPLKSNPVQQKKQHQKKSQLQSVSNPRKAIRIAKPGLFNTRVIWHSNYPTIHPKTVMVQKSPESLTLVCGWWLHFTERDRSIGQFVSFALAFISFCLMIYGFYQIIMVGNVNWCLSIVVPSAFLGLMIHLFITFNKTIIKVTKTELNIMHTGLTLFENQKLQLAQLSHLQHEVCETENDGFKRDYHRLYALTVNNRRIKILPYYMQYENEVAYVKHEIETWLRFAHQSNVSNNAKQLNMLP